MVGIGGALVSLVGLAFPPVIDFVKKKFLSPSQDTPEATLSSLATTKPEVLPEYTNALAHLKEVQIKYYNRDVIGETSRWVVDLRASIRPIFVIISLGYLFVSKYYGWSIDPWFAYLMDATISSWFGSRLVKS